MNYMHATQLRTQAETTADPAAYMRAAAAFMLLNMPAAALRMLERSHHYKANRPAPIVRAHGVRPIRPACGVPNTMHLAPVQPHRFVRAHGVRPNCVVPNAEA